MTLSIELPCRAEHPNRLPFQGRLTILDRPSDKAPSGSRGHRVILTRTAAKAALPGLIGMAVDFTEAWDGHDARQKCGIITSATLGKASIDVEGFVYVRDYPEVREAFGTKELGMSYEMSDAHVVDMRDTIWTISRTTFTGAAILLRDKAAYRGTFCKVAA